MSLVPFGEEIYDTTIDVNNGQYSDTFRQGDDSEFDVDISGTISKNQLSTSRSRSWYQSSGTEEHSIHTVLRTVPEVVENVSVDAYISSDESDYDDGGHLKVEALDGTDTWNTIVEGNNETYSKSNTASFAEVKWVRVEIDVYNYQTNEYDVTVTYNIPDNSYSLGTSTNSITKA